MGEDLRGGIITEELSGYDSGGGNGLGRFYMTGWGGWGDG